MTEKTYPKGVIYGDVVSKSNQYRVVKIGGHAKMAKSKAVEAYEHAFFLQNPLRDANITEFFELYLDAYFSSNRKDLDNALKVVLDCLQRSGTIKNDRQCVKIVARKFIDKYRPRVEFTITPVEGIDNRTTKEPDLFE